MKDWQNETEWLNMTNHGAALLGTEGSIQQAFSYLLNQFNYYLPLDLLLCTMETEEGNRIDIAEAFSENHDKSKHNARSVWNFEYTVAYSPQFEGQIYLLNKSETHRAMPIKTRHGEYKSMLTFSVEEKPTRTMFITLMSQEENAFGLEDISPCLQATRDLRRILETLFALPQMPMGNVYFQKQQNSHDLLRMCRCLTQELQIIEKIAPLSTTVLISGETGVGKELVAETLHYLSPRSKAPFLKLNCGSLPQNLIESILFGHEKGAFTGATESRSGYFEDAHTGTIFLDEIGELPLDSQVRLLRVLENGEISRVGSTRTRNVDVRVLAATNRDLKAMTEASTFRADLYYRLAAFPLHIPPLRERRTDIPILVTYYAKHTQQKLGFKHMPEIPAEFITACTQAEWRGNVRELIHALEYSLVMAQIKNAPLQFLLPGQDKPTPEQGKTERADGILTLNEMNKRYIEDILRKTAGIIHGPKGAAKLLGINPSTLKSRMQALGIDKKLFEEPVEEKQ